MKILMVYPQYPDTFWSFKHALGFISKKAAFPPLGLLTVAAMLPKDWEIKLIDMNVAHLKDKDIKWADYVFISAMSVQSESVWSVIKRCKDLDARTVAGGPYFTMQPDLFKGHVDHLVLNEAEITLQPFIEDVIEGCPKPLYQTTEWPDISSTPVPRWDLLDINKYSSVCVQYSRGCPFDCEFCDIVILNGHTPRTKSAEQLIGDLQGLHERGWKQSVFIVDDNFIGNKRKLKSETLPALIKWMDKIKHPFSFITEASVNLSDDEELMHLMAEAGFDTVFVGIETPNDDSLTECGKKQNLNRNLVDAVRVLHNHGLQVHGGFIVGFDSDPISIFENQISFIQNSGIVTAMVGLLNAPHGTKLHKRLQKEKSEYQKYVLSEFLVELLQITDNLERALKTKEHSSDERSIISGVEMIHKQMVTLLNKYHVFEIESLYKPFDPLYHQAIAKIEQEDVEEPQVIEVYQKGYLYNDKLLRPAFVKVAVPPLSKSGMVEEE